MADLTRKAAIAVADRARDTADCRDLLDAFGLLNALRQTKPKPKRMGRPPVDHGHGHHATYDKGCRCPACREAHRQRCAEQRAKRRLDPSRADRAGHGNTSTYRNYACRCAACTAANTERSAAYRAARAARKRVTA